MKTLGSARSCGFLLALAAGACDDEPPSGQLSHEGEPCDTPDEAQACGEDGVEICLGGTWSACSGPCSEPGTTRPCMTQDDYSGIEHCIAHGSGLPRWGTCSVGHEGVPCDIPDEVQACGDDGIELCNHNKWSACFDTCSELGATRPCTTVKDTPGVERCVVTPDPDFPPIWGTCAPDECEPGESADCGFGPGEFENWTQACLVGKFGVTQWDDEACNTPLVLAFDVRDPVFTTPRAAAAFDITGTNACTTPDWPTAATPWLARDLDRSGTIDGGHELFGNGTLLPSGDHARHGFEALAQLDSNKDSAITPADLAWPELLLWSDHDSDRRSTHWELLPLPAHGVTSLSLDYHLAPVCDPRGNCTRERASFTREHTSRARGELIDVYLQCE